MTKIGDAVQKQFGRFALTHESTVLKTLGEKKEVAYNDGELTITYGPNGEFVDTTDLTTVPGLLEDIHKSVTASITPVSAPAPGTPAGI
jgi:hypothetical protein